MNKHILDAIGNTPLIEINLGQKKAKILAKAEFLNPSGSIKDRMAFFMIEMAERRRLLKPGSIIIEATTGNTGIAFAMISAVKKYSMIAVMPENMSLERQLLIKAFGAKVVLTPASEGPMGAIRKRDLLAKEIKNSWVPDQFENIDNADTYTETFAKEILEQTNGKIDVFVAGIGTGGTLMGTAKKLKEINLNIKIIAVEPKESAVLSKEKPGNHNIQGIGEGFIPKIVDLNLIDQIEKVSTKEAEQMARRLAFEQGLLVGTSSGANLVASLRFVEKGKNIITVLFDRGERYFSQNTFD